jgi:hypothetical protein
MELAVVTTAVFASPVLGAGVWTPAVPRLNVTTDRVSASLVRNSGAMKESDAERSNGSRVLVTGESERGYQ